MGRGGGELNEIQRTDVSATLPRLLVAWGGRETRHVGLAWSEVSVVIMSRDLATTTAMFLLTLVSFSSPSHQLLVSAVVGGAV